MRSLIAGMAFVMTVIAVQAHGTPSTDQRVHASGLCWEPDVEFPVPCDDDDD